MCLWYGDRILNKYSRSRALGALAGLAVGDALGAPVEFCERGSFAPVTAMTAGECMGCVRENGPMIPPWRSVLLKA